MFALCYVKQKRALRIHKLCPNVGVRNFKAIWSIEHIDPKGCLYQLSRDPGFDRGTLDLTSLEFIAHLGHGHELDTLQAF